MIWWLCRLKCCWGAHDYHYCWDFESFNPDIDTWWQCRYCDKQLNQDKTPRI